MIILPQTITKMKESKTTSFVELYSIQLRTGMLYIAAADIDIEFDGKLFKAIPLQRETVERSIDNVVESCNISLGDGDYDKLAAICNGFDFRGCNVDIIKIVYPDSLNDNSIFTWIFSGYIDEPSFSAGVFSCTLKTRLPNIQVPNRVCQLCCNSDFGDDECTMSLNETHLKLVNGSTNDILILPQNYATDFWKNGSATINGESRLIISSSGNTVTIAYSFLQDGIGENTEVTLLRGCDKTKETCKNTFNNLQHFSGFPAIPYEAVYR